MKGELFIDYMVTTLIVPTTLSALNAVYAALEKHRSGRSLVAKLTNRGLDELNAHDRYLDELNSQLMLVRTPLF